MPTIRVGTFNVENLFLRYRPFLENLDATKRQQRLQELLEKGVDINKLQHFLTEYGPVGDAARKLTAQVIRENNPHVLAVQEVENLEALIDFNSKYLGGKFKYMMVIDGNDPRQIDVGILSKHEIGSIRSHRFDPKGSGPRSRTFSRDCLEVEILVGAGKTLRVLVNHFKSKLETTPEGAARATEKRRAQANRVAAILQERFGPGLEGDFVVLGDLNNGNTAEELAPLVHDAGVENVVDRLPADQQWTHYYAPEHDASQFDYVLLAPSLSGRTQGMLPTIERRGLASDTTIYTGERFERVKRKDGASDHCAVFMDLPL